MMVLRLNEIAGVSGAACAPSWLAGASNMSAAQIEAAAVRCNAVRSVDIAKACPADTRKRKPAAVLPDELSAPRENIYLSERQKL